MKAFLRVVIVVVILSFLIILNSNERVNFFNGRDMADLKAPDFTLATLSGEHINFEQFREGKKTIIFFWATWCPHCREALRELNLRKQEFLEKGIKLALVDLGEEKAIVQRYMTIHQLPFNVFLDEESSLSAPYDLLGVPTFYFVDEQGIVKDVRHRLPDNIDNVFRNS